MKTSEDQLRELSAELAQIYKQVSGILQKLNACNHKLLLITAEVSHEKMVATYTDRDLESKDNAK